MKRGMLVCLLCLLTGAAFAASSLRAVQGAVQVHRGDAWLPAKTGMELREGDELVAPAAAEAFIRFHDGARMAVRPESQIQLQDLRLTGPLSLRQKTVRIVRGGLRYISGKATVRQRVSFQTVTSTIGIRGTDIEIMVADDGVNDDPAGTYLKVNRGVAVLAAVNGDQVDVQAGQLAFGGEPELTPRGLGMPHRPAARMAKPAAAAAFKGGQLDRLMD